jgi:hypothetical protein
LDVLWVGCYSPLVLQGRGCEPLLSVFLTLHVILQMRLSGQQAL